VELAEGEVLELTISEASTNSSFIIKFRSGYTTTITIGNSGFYSLKVLPDDPIVSIKPENILATGIIS